MINNDWKKARSDFAYAGCANGTTFLWQREHFFAFAFQLQLEALRRWRLRRRLSVLVDAARYWDDHCIATTIIGQSPRRTPIINSERRRPSLYWLPSCEKPLLVGGLIRRTASNVELITPSSVRWVGTASFLPRDQSQNGAAAVIRDVVIIVSTPCASVVKKLIHFFYLIEIFHRKKF